MRFYSLLFFIGILVFVSACKSDEKDKLLIQKWKMAFNQTEVWDAMKPAEQKILKSLTEQEQKKAWLEIEKKIHANTFEFRKDKSFEIILKEEETVNKGTWELASSRLILSKNTQNQAKTIIQDEFYIQELKEKKMVLEFKDKSGKIRKIVMESL